MKEFNVRQLLRSNYDGNYGYCIRELTNAIEKLCETVEKQQEEINKLKGNLNG